MSIGKEKFDRVEFQLTDGSTKTYTKKEFESLPLADRVQGIMKGKAKFFLNGQPVKATDALKI